MTNSIFNTDSNTFLPVGTRFTNRSSRSYTENGAKGVHETVRLCEVTETDEVGFQYVVVELLSEADRPSFAGNSIGLGGGSFAWFGWDNAARRGDVVVVNG